MLVEGLASGEYNAKSHRILSRDITESELVEEKTIEPPENHEEEIILEELKRLQNQQLSEEKKQAALVRTTTLPSDPLTAAEQPPKPFHRTPVFKAIISDDRCSNERSKYHYYEPVYWKPSCISCHEGMYGKFAQSVADHILGNIDRYMAAAVVYSNCMSNHLWKNHRGATPSAYHFLFIFLIHALNAFEQFWLNVRAFFQ